MTTRSNQPVTVPTGLPYGERQQLEQAQKAIPLPTAAPGRTAQPSGTPPPQNPNVFAPTNRPNEPITAGASQGAGPSPILPDMSGTELLRALIMNGYDQSGDLRRLLERTQPKPRPQAQSQPQPQVQVPPRQRSTQPGSPLPGQAPPTPPGQPTQPAAPPTSPTPPPPPPGPLNVP